VVVGLFAVRGTLRERLAGSQRSSGGRLRASGYVAAWPTPLAMVIRKSIHSCRFYMTALCGEANSCIETRTVVFGCKRRCNLRVQGPVAVEVAAIARTRQVNSVELDAREYGQSDEGTPDWRLRGEGAMVARILDVSSTFSFTLPGSLASPRRPGTRGRLHRGRGQRMAVDRRPRGRGDRGAGQTPLHDLL
jgi:hypothetical protein